MKGFKGPQKNEALSQCSVDLYRWKQEERPLSLWHFCTASCDSFFRGTEYDVQSQPSLSGDKHPSSHGRKQRWGSGLQTPPVKASGPPQGCFLVSFHPLFRNCEPPPPIPALGYHFVMTHEPPWVRCTHGGISSLSDAFPWHPEGL